MLKTVKTPSGERTIAYETWGDPKAHPVFLLHGTPGSRLGPRLRTFDLHKLGVRLIAYDRRGTATPTAIADVRWSTRPWTSASSPRTWT